MKRKPSLFLGLLGLIAVTGPGPILAAPLGSHFSYQGFLVRNASPANGLFDLEFNLRDAPLAGNPVGPPLILEDTFVTNGLFTVILDFGDGVFSGQARWMDISIRPGAETGPFALLPPRDALLPTPHAHYARLAGAVDWSGISGVPPGLADGDQDTTYTAGSGLALNGQQFQVVFGGLGLLNTVARSDHHHDELRVNNLPALRLVPGPNSPNLLGGYASNKVATGVNGATIGGGGSDESAGPMDGPNRVDAHYATIAGGNRNAISSSGVGSVVSGGSGNLIDAQAGVIGGGRGNRIFSSSDYAVIPGGQSNEVSAPYAVAMGRGARANHEGAFVWADASSPNLVPSSRTNQMTLRAGNGVRFLANAGPNKPMEVGERYRDNSLFAWAKVNANGSADTDLGVMAIDHVATGVYEITLDASALNADNLIPVASPLLPAPPTDALSVRFLGVKQMSVTQFRVFINNGLFAPVDAPFTFMVTGR